MTTHIHTTARAPPLLVPEVDADADRMTKLLEEALGKAVNATLEQSRDDPVRFLAAYLLQNHGGVVEAPDENGSSPPSFLSRRGDA